MRNCAGFCSLSESPISHCSSLSSKFSSQSLFKFLESNGRQIDSSSSSTSRFLKFKAPTSIYLAEIVKKRVSVCIRTFRSLVCAVTIHQSLAKKFFNISISLIRSSSSKNSKSDRYERTDASGTLPLCSDNSTHGVGF